jgi:hypothetical protein
LDHLTLDFDLPRLCALRTHHPRLIERLGFLNLRLVERLGFLGHSWKREFEIHSSLVIAIGPQGLGLAVDQSLIEELLVLARVDNHEAERPLAARGASARPAPRLALGFCVEFLNTALY